MEGTSPLHVACRNGDIQLIKHLVLHGASVNDFDNIGDTTLHYIVNNTIARQFDEECLRYMLEQKDINLKLCNAMEATALHVAIVRGRVDFADILINHFKDTQEKKMFINKPDIGKMTSLMLAIYGKHVTLCETLLNAGADPNAIITSDNPMDNNLMPIHIACMSNLPELISKLLPITDLTVIKNLLKYSPDKACLFRICHENLSESELSLESLLKTLKADDFVTYFEVNSPNYYPSDDEDGDQPDPTMFPAFWFLRQRHILPYVGETPLAHYLRNNWRWVNRDENGQNIAIQVIQRYIENQSSVNELSVGNNEEYTIPPMLALCCVTKELRMSNPKIIKLMEDILDHMVERGSRIPRKALTFACLNAQPLIFKTMCERGAVMVENIDIDELIDGFKTCSHAQYILPFPFSIFYYFYFFGYNNILNNGQYESIRNHLEKLFEKYTVYDQKLDQRNESLVKECKLLKLCRNAIRKQLNLHNDENINDLIKRLPGLPLDLYDFLCIKTLKIKKIKLHQ